MTNDSRLANGGSCSSDVLSRPAPIPGQSCLWVYRYRGRVLQETVSSEVSSEPARALTGFVLGLDRRPIGESR